MSNKNENFELRIVLIGEIGVGKKSIVKRFKLLNCTETKEFIRKKESIEEKVSKIVKIKSRKSKDNVNTITLDTKSKSKTKSDSEEFTKDEIEQKKLELRREEKRLDLMNFAKIYKFNMINLEINFFPCIEAQPLPYDYEFREDDEFYEFEKEYKLTLKPLIKQLEHIIMKPSENENTQIEFLFLLCFDLSDINSFEKLLLYFGLIEKHFKLSSNFKIVLIGNKMDKKIAMTNEQKEGIEHLISQLNSTYYEISTLMFFQFENFFEKLIFENLDLSIFSNEESKKYFIELLTQKNNFSKAKREYYQDNKVPGPNKYFSNQYQYPNRRREFLKIFQDTDKFNKKIFINKTGTLFPPLKKNKDKDYNSYAKDRILKDKKKEIYSFETNKKVQEEIELNSRKPGYSFGLVTYKPLNLKHQRKLLSESRDAEIDRFLTEGGTSLYHQVKSMNKGKLNQEKYEKKRLENQKKFKEDKKKLKEEIQRRHDEINEKNLMETNEKIDLILKKDKKYKKRYEDRERKKIRKQKLNILKNNSESEIPKRISEPKGKFYTPMSSISTNKGFTFGHKSSNQIVKQDYPDFPLFKDDFEKLILKNKKINFVKQKGQRFPEYKPEEVGDSSHIMENQKKFELNRNLIRTSKINGFLMDRKNKREEVLQRKKELSENQENELKEQIMKQYKTDSNYLIREINYSQVENASPKFTMRDKYEFGSIFQYDKQTHNNDDSNNQFGYSTLFNPDISTKLSTINLENPDFSVIRPKYPVYSFSKSKRFNFTTDNFDKNKSKYINTDINIPFTNYFDYKDTQSFLKAQTSMGTGKKYEIQGNGYPGPDFYKLRRFADEVVLRGNEVNLSRIKVREKEKLDKIDRERRAKLRDQWLEEKKYVLKMSIKDSLFNNNINTNSINNDNHCENINDEQNENNTLENNKINHQLTL